MTLLYIHIVYGLALLIGIAYFAMQSHGDWLTLSGWATAQRLLHLLGLLMVIFVVSTFVWDALRYPLYMEMLPLHLTCSGVWSLVIARWIWDARAARKDQS